MPREAKIFRSRPRLAGGKGLVKALTAHWLASGRIKSLRMDHPLRKTPVTTCTLSY